MPLIFILMLFFIYIIVSIIFGLKDKEDLTKKKHKEICNKKTHTEKDYKTKEEYIGKVGEDTLAKEINTLLPGAIILRNLYIPTYYSRTTEIDMVMLHKTGVYCFECKNYSGEIFGSEEEDYWTEYFYPSKKSFKLFNPIKQNRIHIKYLRRLLCLSSTNIYNCVVFIKNKRIPDIKINPNEGFFCNLEDLYTNITFMKNYKPEVYSEKNLRNIEKKLSRYTNVPEYVKKKHIKDIEDFKNKNNYYS